MSAVSFDVDKPLRGVLRKQSPHIGVFRRRDVVLSPVGMQVYNLGDNEKALAIIPITAETVVSDIKVCTVRGGHGASYPNQAAFQVIPNVASSASSYRPRIFGSATEEHWFSATSEEEAQMWKSAIEERVKVLAKGRAAANSGMMKSLEAELNEGGLERTTPQDGQKKLVLTESMLLTRDEKQRNMRERLKRTASQKIPILPKLANTSINLIQQAEWREAIVSNGIRIMAEVALTKDNPCLRVNCVLPASPDRALRLYYDFERRSDWDNLTESVHVLNEEYDGHLRTMHCKLRGTRVGGFWMAPRDYVVDSSWRKDDDGSIVIIETVNRERKVPEENGTVRAEIYTLGITLCPRRCKTKDGIPEPSRRVLSLDDENEEFEEVDDCLLQMAVHANVGGWLAKMPLDWSRQWLYAFMLRVIGFKEVLEQDNYKAVDYLRLTKHSSSTTEEKPELKRKAPSEPGQPQPQDKKIPDVTGTLSSECVYNNEEPFNVRSKTYLVDRKKEPSQGNMFELIAMDLWEVSEPIENVAVNMKGGAADKYLNTPGPKPFLFIVQFQIPGPPFLSFVAYFAAKSGVLENVTPFSRLFADFCDGTDEFRDSRFKFIPRVVKGSYVVRSAVGQTPALIGNKLVCTYHKGDGYFEIDVDVGSSNVAGGVLRVVKGYVTSLTIDLCFLLEAQHEEELPETILGSLRFEKLSLDMAKRWPPAQ